MNRSPNVLLSASLAAALAAGAARAQSDPPPWWGKSDNDTVSLAWTFDNPASPAVPTFVVAPPWHSLAVTNFAPSPQVQWLPAFQGRTGVFALTGNGSPLTGAIALTVDNDPRPYWIKIFWLQYDEFTSGTGSVSAAIRQDLANYGRAEVHETSAPLPGGWNRVTLECKLLPQPWSETVDWSFVETALGTSAIDNLFVNSKCVQPPPDETGEPLGEVAVPPIDLQTTTGQQQVEGIAAFGAGALRRYWVTVPRPSAAGQHLLLELNAAGTVLRTIPQPGLVQLSSARGITDLAFEPRTPTGPKLHGIAFAGGAGRFELFTFDLNTGAWQAVGVPTALAAANLDGFVFNPDGQNGAGTFLVADPTAAAPGLVEIDRAGQVVRQRSVPLPGIRAIAYDEVLGSFWCLTDQALPNDPLRRQVVGFEISGYSLQPTGVRFFGDASIPASPTSPPGGIAAGLALWRPTLPGPNPRSTLRLVCLVTTGGVGGSEFLYELHGPYRFGWSLEGRMGMVNGPPFGGNAQFGLSLTGVPNASFATLFLGFSNTVHAGFALPLYFNAGAGLPVVMPETAVSIALQVQGPTVPVFGGTAGVPVPVPPGLAPGRLFFQWLVFDATVPNGFTLSQAGKTWLYP